uniref:Uncharacterized protein n=1 Tax=Balaenoptera musculus TaxID=9771 RepID=A0A8C0DMY9_BALMU
MAASHRAAKVAASSLQTPVNPSTGARVTHYERKDPVESLSAAAAAALEEEEEEKEEKEEEEEEEVFSFYPADFNTNISGVNEQKRISCEDFVDFSDIYHSNEEYFRKLEELKAAHMETMAKLEKMYQNKLNLKEVQPAITMEEAASVSST